MEKIDIDAVVKRHNEKIRRAIDIKLRKYLKELADEENGGKK
jgi:hypothetical protein